VCINSVVYSIDNYAYYNNNVTLNKNTAEVEGPLMNFSRAIAGNGTAAIVNCQLFGNSVWKYTVIKAASFNNDIFNYSLSFLFN
jgi:hypothetical protein